MTFSLAFRNLMRNRRRSITTLLAMMVGVTSMLIFGGYAHNAVLMTQTGYVQYLGHFQIQRKGYFRYGSGNPVDYGIENYQRIVDVVKDDPILKPMLVVVTPTLRVNGVAGNYAAHLSKGVVTAGIVVEDQNKMRQWDEYGSLSHVPPIELDGTPQESAVIGTGVARMLQLCAPFGLSDCPSAEEIGADSGGGDGAAVPDSIAALTAQEQEGRAQPHGNTGIELLATSPRGAPNVTSLNVVAAQNWGVKEIDDTMIVTHLGRVQRLVYGAAPPQVTAIQIQLAHTAQMPVARARLESLLRNEFKDARFEVLDYEELTPIYKQVIQFFDSIFGFISILIWVIVLFTVGNTMNMAVVERTVEIGTVRAIGQRRVGIRRMFVYEGAFLGLFGVLLGIAVALPAAYLINHSGWTWAPPGYSYEYPVVVRVWGDFKLIFGSAIGLVVVSVISAWWPASRAAKLHIVEALRHV